MRIPRFLHRRGISLVLVLVLSLLGFLPQLAHASTYVGYGSANQGASTCGSNCWPPGTTQIGGGEIVQAPVTGTLNAAGFFTGALPPNQIVILTFPVGAIPASTTYSCGAAGTCAFVNAAQTFTVKDVESLSGLGGSTFFTVNLAAPVSVTQNQYVGIVFMQTVGNPATGMLMFAGTGGSTAFFDTCFGFGSTNPAIGSTSLTGSGACSAPNAAIVGGSFNPSGTTGTTITQTQCYGNCGSPAVTLANTNSTHTINFNGSKTLFYEFQSNLNGFLLNVTANVAKSYNNGINTAIGVYETPGLCPQGTIQFTASCPALRVLGANNFVGTVTKGQIFATASNGEIPVSNGQWVAVAITASFSGFDLNDTNTNVPLFVTNGGVPLVASITQAASAASLCAGCKMGLWAWIIGNVVSGGGPSQPTVANCGPGLDCILTSVVNSFCSVITTACQTSSAMFWTIILTIITIMVVSFCFSSILPTVNLGRTGLAEMSVLIFVLWIAIFTSFGLMSLYVLALIFAITAILFSRKVNSYI